MFAAHANGEGLNVLFLILVIACLFGAAFLFYTRRIVEGAALALLAIIVAVVFLA